jgi:uncharacterized protein (TIGR02284 family)
MNNSANAQTIKVLNDLIQLHNNRLEAYQKVNVSGKENLQIKNILLEGGLLSYEMREQLIKEVVMLDGNPALGKSLNGKSSHTWSTVIKIVSNYNYRKISAAFETGEYVTLLVYRNIMKANLFPAHLIRIVSKQKEAIFQQYEKIKNLRKPAIIKQEEFA